MADTTHDMKELRAYLLGGLGEDETARLDELGFTDDEFAGRLRAAGKELIDDYVRGALIGDEFSRFEAHYLATPRRRKSVEFAGALRQFLDERNAREPSLAANEESTPGIFAAFAAYWRRAAGFGIALAAIALLFVAVGLWRDYKRLSEQAATNEKRLEELRRRENELDRRIEDGNSNRPANEKTDDELRRELEKPAHEIAKSPGEGERESRPVNAATPDPSSAKNRTRPPLTIASIVLAAPLRGGGNTPTLKLGRDAKFVDATLEVETNEFSAFRVRLVGGGGATRWSSGALRSRSTGGRTVVNLRLPAQTLRTGVFTLVLTGVGATGEVVEIGGYPLRIVVN